MLFHKVLSQVTRITQSVVKTVERRFKAWTAPSSDSMVGGVVADLVKSKQQVILENAFLRQQVIVLKRQIARPALTAKDRSLLVLLASRVHDWKNTLLLVKPETLLRWHRAGFRLF
jgi:putative transposase